MHRVRRNSKKAKANGLEVYLPEGWKWFDCECELSHRRADFGGYCFQYSHVAVAHGVSSSLSLILTMRN